MTQRTKRAPRSVRLADKQAAMRDRMLIKAEEQANMALTDPKVINEAECICGRIARKAHCSNCGTYDVYARGPRNDIVKMDPVDGTKHRVTTFRCRRCGVFFDSDDWQINCKAPQYITKATQRRDREMMEPKRTIKVDDAQMLLAVNKIRATRGLEPITKLDKSGETKQ